LLVPWTLYLDYQVTTECEGRKWDLPSRVYARPLELFPGERLSRADLEQELKFAGYHSSPSADKPGRYHVSGQTIDIYRRSFQFPEGTEEPRLLRVVLADDSVAG
jgi:penicillin-binding protein 1B